MTHTKVFDTREAVPYSPVAMNEKPTRKIQAAPGASWAGAPGCLHKRVRWFLLPWGATPLTTPDASRLVLTASSVTQGPSGVGSLWGCA